MLFFVFKYMWKVLDHVTARAHPQRTDEVCVACPEAPLQALHDDVATFVLFASVGHEQNAHSYI